VPPEGNCRIFCHPYIKKIKLKNDDADMTNFMLLCMLLGGGFADRYSSRRNGANTIDGKTAARGPGSLIYEPYGLVHQWGNPGDEPLTFLAFNINPEGVAAVLPGAPAKSQ
jgi:hypothetical protein